ncbi:hypothetical protein ACIQZD_00290 [Peribacillus sp. NPDC096447]|uniref:hypothetical protein n=1 Tax=Peribacillus sp. NPDC096447 TaxID=3364394 RepID=UPI00382833CA
MNKLKRLELHYCTNLQDDFGMSGLANTLEHLHINQSKKFVPNEELFSLTNQKGEPVIFTGQPYNTDAPVSSLTIELINISKSLIFSILDNSFKFFSTIFIL